MGNKYFDSWELQQILDITKTNPLEAKAKYEEYLEKYPTDYISYRYYIEILIILNDLDQAEKVLNYIQNKANNDKTFSNLEKKEMFNDHLSFVRLKLLTYQEKYEELYHSCLEFPNRIETNLNSITFYCKKKLGMLDPSIRDKNAYLFRQIIQYEESDFLRHIKKHQADSNKDLDKPNKNIFTPDFPFDEVINEIKKYIPSDKKLCTGFYENVYTFKYNNCGRVDNKMVNYFKVICFNNTQEFITMIPTTEGKYLPYTDLNYLITDTPTQSSKVKRVRQIDKFNQKYGRN